MPTSAYLPVHVFYPTEQEGGALPFAEFLVERPTASCPWTAILQHGCDRLAYHLRFVNDAFAETPRQSCRLACSVRGRDLIRRENWRRISTSEIPASCRC